MPESFTTVTLNMRTIRDRWLWRAPLLRSEDRRLTTRRRTTRLDASARIEQAR